MGPPRHRSAGPAADGPLDHRRILDHRGSFHPFRGTDLFARIGGQPTVDRLVDGLYDRLAADAGFGILFARDLTAERARLKLFFGEWLGGERRYSGSAFAGLAHRHEELEITRALADRWVGHFRAAFAAAVADPGIRAAVGAPIASFARSLVNAERIPVGAQHAQGMCLSPRHHPAMVATDRARRGDRAGLDRVLRASPAVLSRRTYQARVLNAAASAGKTEVVRRLIEAGAGVDTPCPMPVAIAGGTFWGVLYLTPLCAALAKRRGAVAELLLAHGAKDDVFTAAFLGDLPGLERQLAANAELADASDPAVDALDITPLHHAVAGGRAAAVEVLLGRITGEPRGLDQALRAAAERDDEAIVALLIGRGAATSAIDAGRWVLHPRIAPLLARAGASIGRSGAWIGLSCTGNQGRKDDPDYVHALLRHGARADDRRQRGGEDATALHFAAKAGFVRTIAVLLENGADPRARDAAGLTPLDWLERAAKSVDRAAVRRLLAR